MPVDELKCTDRIMNHTFWIGVFPGPTKAYFGVNF